eukprot:TRINITY_DN8304_c0_g1_i1.p1 TRINITY_DN8304_c0_g1~~TRINITY_DN8304_c0_g1_i1.p1  ORF type:complete len:749 (+),score=190.11 TRINITY_DN8304_c0_g1_i1:104-2350(+)
MTTASHALMTAGTGGDAHEENRGLLFEKFLLKLPGRVKSIEFPVLSLCTCLAVLTAISSVIVQLNSDILYAFRSYLQEQTDNVFFGFLLWAAHTLTLVFIAIFITDKFAPAAAGSGVPQMKTIISGSGNPQWLSKKTLLVKFVGLCCTSASGMFCGGVGPFIHIGAMFAETLMKHVPWFQQLRRHPGIYPQLLVVGCSVGITSSLGVPIGGTLFGVEVTSAMYLTRTYWWTSFAAPIAGVLFIILINTIRQNWTNLLQPFAHLNFDHLTYTASELVFFVFLGVLIGLLCVPFTMLVCQAMYWRRRINQRHPLLATYVYPMGVALVTTVVTYPGFLGKFVSIGNIGTFWDLMVPDLTDDNPLHQLKADDWSKGEASLFLWFALIGLLLMRLVLTPLATTLPYPAGFFFPAVTIGTLFGRIFGEVLRSALPHGLDGHSQIVPSGYAAIAGGAFCSAFTGTVSASIIVLEITSSIDWLFPMLITTVTAMLVVKPFMVSAYDCVAVISDLKYLPDLKYKFVDETDADVPVRDLMHFFNQERSRSVSERQSLDVYPTSPRESGVYSRLDAHEFTRPSLDRSKSMPTGLVHTPRLSLDEPPLAHSGSFEMTEIRPPPTSGPSEIRGPGLQNILEAGVEAYFARGERVSSRQKAPEPSPMTKEEIEEIISEYLALVDPTQRDQYKNMHETLFQVRADTSIFYCHAIFSALKNPFLIVVDPEASNRIIGVITRDDLAAYFQKQLKEEVMVLRLIKW